MGNTPDRVSWTATNASSADVPPLTYTPAFWLSHPSAPMLQDTQSTAEASQDLNQQASSATPGSTSSASALPVELRVVTLNVWGLKWISSDRVPRLQAIAEVLSGRRSTHNLAELGTAVHAWDLICLQEVWIPSEAQMLALAAQCGGLKYWRFFRSGALGSGLLICSRYPLRSSRMCPYKLNGHPLRLLEGDWFVAKGVATVTLSLEGGRTVEVMNTHLYAPGGPYRLAQVWELAAHIRSARDKGRHVVLCGDLNAQPDSRELRLLKHLTGLQDSWSRAHSDSSQSSAATALEGLQTLGITSNSPLGTYTGPHKSGLGKKLDYILCSPEITPTHSEVAFTGHTQHQTSFSDHFGVSAVLSFAAAPHGQTDSGPVSLPQENLQDLLNALESRSIQSKKESRQLLSLCAVCISLSVASPIAASFQPLQYLNWIWPLLSSGAGVLGTLGLTVGFVGGRWEVNAIESIRQEILERMHFS